MIRVKSLHIYPVKSLAGISVSKATIGDRGFENDRRWMLIDENNRFLSQRELPEMALIKTRIDFERLIVWHNAFPENLLQISIPHPKNTSIEVSVWDDICKAIICPDEVATWFSRILNFSCRLVYMPTNSHRYVDNRFAKNNEINSFSDDFPITIISQESLNDLNEKMELPILMNRFRPNIVIEGCRPFEEDKLETFSINGMNFNCAKPLARCPIPTINQETATKSKEPLATLSKFRKRDNKIYFGQNLLYNGRGIINIGDQLTF